MTRRRPGGTAAPVEVRRCAIYTRKSTSAGLDQAFNSLDSQRESCEAYVRAQAHLGWRLSSEHYDDGGFTGANLERPAFRRLMADVEARLVDVVLVYKLDRLSRSLLDFTQVMARFNKTDAAFVSVTQNFSTADAMGRLTLNMLMSFAEFERELIGERTADKIAASRRKGLWTGGPVPLGYEVVAKKLVVNEVEAAIVGEAFDLYDQHGSALVVAQTLTERGRVVRRHAGRQGGGQPSSRWSKPAVLRLLRTPFCAGLVPSHGDLFEGQHAAIIDPERWRRVQATLDEHAGEKTDRGRNPAYILRGLLHCGACGGAMTPASTRRGGREYRYYRCVTRDQEGKKGCPTRQLPADAIEDFVVDRLREATRGGGLADDVLASLRARVQRERAPLIAARRSLPGRIAALSAEGSGLAESLSEARGAARRFMAEKLEAVGEDLAACESRLAQVERSLADLDAVDIEAGWVAQALGRFGEVWDALTPQNRARLVHAVVERVEVDEATGRASAVLVDLGIGNDEEEAA